jgi:hypothetical protein
MTELRRPKEQIAIHTYRQQLPGESGIPAVRGTAGGRSARAEASVQRRVVRMPDSVVQPTPWAERKAHERRTHANPHANYSNSRLRPRTLAQTGVPAASGQIRIIRPLPKRRIGSPVPVRSGRNARGGFWGRLLALFAVVVIGIVGVTFALTSSTFRVQEVNVVGANNAALVKSIQHMGMQGQNIFLLDTAAFTALITMLPLVASATLGKELPNSLTVTVVERTPTLLWQTKQGTYSVDKTGMVMAPASETSGADQLMTVVDRCDLGGTSQQAVHPGVRLNAMDIAFAMKVFAGFPKVAGVNDFKLCYDYAGQNNGSYVVESPDGWIAYLGGADNANPLDNRLIELKQILALAQQQQLNLATIDLRFGLRPVYTLKS